MKKIVLLLVISALCFSTVPEASAQTEEAQQLLLNVEKLAQLKEILNNLYKSYEIVSKGYTTIKDISEGNFNLHKAFLDNLMQVSPAIRNYKKVADIISYQVKIVNEYKKAYKSFKSNSNFNTAEIEYIGKVYNNLFDKSIKNIDALVAIITANKLRMSDDERLEAIDKLYNDMQDKLSYLRHFNNNTSVLALQRAKEKRDANTIENLYDVNQ